MQPTGGIDEPEGWDHCRSAHCSQRGPACAYVDRRGRRCPTHWCADHHQLMGPLVYCRRHAGTIAALGDGAGRMKDRPLVDNRAASLTDWVSTSLDDHIQSLLVCLRGVGETLVADPSIMERDNGRRDVRWHRGWSLVKPHGVTTRVAVEISEDDDAMVLIRVDRNIVFASVPPWIAWHRLGLNVPGPVDDAARKAFYGKVKIAVADELVRTRLARPQTFTSAERELDAEAEPE